VDTYEVEWEGGLKARGEGRLVRFEPHPGEWAGPFALGWWCIRYGKRLHDRKVGVVVIPSERISMQSDGTGVAGAHRKAVGGMIEEWVLAIHACSNVWHRQVIDTVVY
jgi:hypothetical protein